MGPGVQHGGTGGAQDARAREAPRVPGHLRHLRPPRSAGRVYGGRAHLVMRHNAPAPLGVPGRVGRPREMFWPAAQESLSGSPGGLTSDFATASLERLYAASHFAY